MPPRRPQIPKPRIGMLYPKHRDEIAAVIAEIPFDLSDERSSKKNRFWAEFSGRFLNPRVAVDGHINGVWMGFRINAFLGYVTQPLTAFGKPVERSLGTLTFVEITRGTEDQLVAATLPSNLGGTSSFICRASSEEFAAIVRMAARLSGE